MELGKPLTEYKDFNQKVFNFYCELKNHDQLFDEGRSKLLDQRK
jgi:hypothetical protein